MSLSPSGVKSTSPLFGEPALRALADDLNKSADAAVIFATDTNLTIRQKALDILEEAERRTGVSTNAVTAYHDQSGTTIIVFRDPATATRADVFEELRHLEYARMGHWHREVPGVFTAFEIRELDAAAHFKNLLKENTITQGEFDDTIRNLAHHLSRPGKPVTEAQARTILERLMPE